MIRVARAAVIAVLATLVSWFAVTPTNAVAKPFTPVLVYAYDVLVHSAPTCNVTTERGPPAACDPGTTHEAVTPWPRGDSAHPVGATTPLAYTYDHPALLVHVASVATIALGRSGTTEGPPSPLEPNHVAANTAVRLRPPVSIPQSQFGAKFGKHAVDYGLDVGDPASRASYMARIRAVHANPDEVRLGQYGAYDEAFMFRQGDDLLITRTDGTFVSLYPGGQTSTWFKNAPVFPH